MMNRYDKYYIVYIGGFYMHRFIIILIIFGFHYVGAVGKIKSSFNEKEREFVKKLQKLVAPKYKKQLRNETKKGDIRKFFGEGKESETEEYFCKNYRGVNGSTLLMDLIKNGGESNDIQALLALGIDVNATDRKDNTALHCVLRGRSKERKKINYTLVALLLNAGADIYARNNEGKTPLSIAQEQDAGTIIQKMLGYEIEKK
jgi:hypothetical protein